MTKSIIVAKAENHVIGAHNQMPWYLPHDLRHFKQVTLGHHVVIGRKTFESLPNGLPGRIIIVLTHDPSYQAPNCKLATSLQEALQIAEEAGETEVFIAGGGTVYQEALSIANQIYLTVVKAHIPGDTFFPQLHSAEWQELGRTTYQADERHAYAYEFIKLIRKL
jgi:dihydrofolate reductase